MYSKEIINELEEIIHRGLEEMPIPVQKGNSIRIGRYVVRKSKNGYLVYCTENNKQIARVFCKASAIAIAKNFATGKNVLPQVLELDLRIQKNVNDALFYKNTMKTTKDPFVKESREVRYDIALAESQVCKDRLESFIFSL